MGLIFETVIPAAYAMLPHEVYYIRLVISVELYFARAVVDNY